MACNGSLNNDFRLLKIIFHGAPNGVMIKLKLSTQIFSINPAIK